MKIIKESSVDVMSIAGDNVDTYVSKNQYGYSVLGLTVDHDTREFQVIDGQRMRYGKHKKVSSKKIKELARFFKKLGYKDYGSEVKYESYDYSNDPYKKSDVRHTGYWYVTNHGLGPGMIPKGVNVLDVVNDGDKTYVELDTALRYEDELNYELVKERPNNFGE